MTRQTAPSAPAAPAPPRAALFDLDGPAGHWRPTRRQAWRFLGLAALAFLATGLALARVPDAVERRADGYLAAKLELLAAHREADILFVGTSQTLFAIDPARVDAGLAEAGCPGRSLNLGMPSARLEDVARLIDAIGAQPRRRAVVLEGGSFGGWVPEGSEQRAEDRLPASLAYLPVVEADVATREQDRLVVLRFAWDALQFELGKHRLYDALLASPQPPPPLPPGMLEAQRGYLVAVEVADIWGLRRRERFLERIVSRYTPEHLAALRARLRPEPAKAAAAAALVAQVEAQDQRPILLLLPANRSISAESARALLAERPGLPAIDLALDTDVLPFPDGETYFDDSHVSRAGAEILSRAVASRLCALLRATPAP